ncbi:hypothetical protein D1AOALGA4SA_640 [Olavius algarvensis Delta 1 endosymbiont]|nr:hypothetical protein D1AOALGA4SA_640 [Olavius algarvensis Delta 1 endosymbiont]
MTPTTGIISLYFVTGYKVFTLPRFGRNPAGIITSTGHSRA